MRVHGALGDPLSQTIVMHAMDPRHAVQLDLYVNYRRSAYSTTDVFPLKDPRPPRCQLRRVRENTEGLYSVPVAGFARAPRRNGIQQEGTYRGGTASFGTP